MKTKETYKPRNTSLCVLIFLLRKEMRHKWWEYVLLEFTVDFYKVNLHTFLTLTLMSLSFEAF